MDIKELLKQKEGNAERLVRALNDNAVQINALQQQREALSREAFENNGAVKVLKEQLSGNHE